EDRDAVGHGHRLGLVVRHVHHGDADLAVNALELDLHLLAQVLVQGPEGLVEQKHIRVEDEATGERDTLLLTAGQLARVFVGEGPQADEVEDRAHALGLPRARKPAHAQRESDVALDRHVGEQRVALEDDADVALVRLAARQILAAELDDATGRLLEAGDHHERRRLPGAARAEEREELALRDVEADAVDGVDAAVVGLHETLELEICQRQALARGTMSASTTTHPAPVGFTTIGFTSSSARLSRSAHAKSPIASSARASAPTSPGGRPRKPPSRLATFVSAIIASASPARRGKGRSATSSSASISTPPAPNAKTRPKSGSRFTPAKTSRIPCAISWMRNPPTSLRWPRSSTRRASRSHAARRPLSSRRPTATRPTSDRCGIASDPPSSTTGWPIVSAASRGSWSGVVSRSRTRGPPPAPSKRLASCSWMVGRARLACIAWMAPPAPRGARGAASGSVQRASRSTAPGPARVPPMTAMPCSRRNATTSRRKTPERIVIRYERFADCCAP